MNMTLSTDKFADESTTERSQSPGDMSEAQVLPQHEVNRLEDESDD